MSRKVTLPKIDARQATGLLKQLRRMAPHYTREWLAKDDADPGVALLKVFSFIVEGVISRLNRAPERNFLAFLDMLGIRLLPATPARVPVRLLLAKGATDAFLVEKGAQVSAPPTGQRPVELPFETIENLWVIPAALTELISVDPSKDHIYKPPPGFLGLELAATEVPSLKVTAFSAADSKLLQLDPPDQVKKGDFLRIDHALEAGSRLTTDCPPPSDSSGRQLGDVDHLVVLDTKGTIVTVTDPLPRDYLEETLVRKVTDFELFEAKNWQEHVLYLGHAEYFAIKSAAQIELLVEHAGGVANLESLDVIWEFFGIDETDKDKEEKWHRFDVELDGTVGFSRSGRVVLNKPAGEIKEKEINGSKSRWIRARLHEPLPATPIRALPKVESLTFAVASGREDLAVDQAFHNDTPLTTDVEFFPFGTEPRIFDRFSLASEEAFSKPGAEIDLEFAMDTSDLLASPAAVFIEDKVHVFAIGAGGKLLEFEINPNVSSVALPVDHEMPKDTQLTAGSTPAVVTDSGSLVAVFARANDEMIHMWDRTVKWKALDKTPGTLQFGPVALRIGSVWRVYAVADNKLYWKNLEPGTSNPATPPWSAILDGPRIDSSPFIIDTGAGTAAIFVTDVAGVTWMFRNNWTPLTPEVSPGVPKEEFVAAKNARPFAVASKDLSNVIVGFKVYLRSKNDALVRLDTVGPSESLNEPDDGAVSNPFMSSFPGHDRIYVRAKDDHLWSIQDVADPHWVDHETSGGINLDGDPFVIAYPPLTGSFLSIFSTSKKNALMEFRVNRDNLGSGNIQFGPKEILLLKSEPEPDGTYYIRIIGGPGQDSSNDAVRKFSDEHSSATFKVLDSPLSESPTEETEFVLMREEAVGDVQAATEVTLTLEDGDGEEVRDGDYLFVANQLRRIPTAPESDDEVTIQDEWDSEPTTGDVYHLLRVNQDPQSDRPAGRSAIRAVLDPDSEEPSGGYENKYLRIIDGPGESPVLRRIDRYFESTNNIAVDADFIEPPTNESSYVITARSEPEAWYVHKDPEQEKLRPELSWEYFNGRGWVGLTAVDDDTDKLLTEGSVKFTLPNDVAKTEVAGQENLWIRARIVGGDYGREQFKFDDINKTVTVEKDPIRPPIVKKLALRYKAVEHKPPQICLTFNNLSYLDQTAANVKPDKHFSPYLQLEDSSRAVYFGFEREFEGGPVRLYFAATELEIDERNKPKLTWEFKSENTWKSLIADDGTDAFNKPGFVSLILPDGFQNSQEFGRTLYWLRATLSKGKWNKSPLFKGVFPNTVATLQARTIRNEILGSSTGIKNQKFQFQQVPVIENEEVRVLEVLTDAEKERLLLERGEDAVRAITDQRGVVLQTWVRWTEVLEFFDSNSESRHYRLDRATGEIEFGDGVRGRIPPAGGDNIQAFAYQTGGGASGNVMPGEIKTAVTAVAGVDSVINPVAAGGGSEAATNDDMLVIGPAQISHRNRAVTPEDFERLAQEASREVRKALCRPNRNAGGRHELGWTSVHIVPDSKDAEPMPSLELRRSVQRFLSDRADVTLVDQDHIFVAPPKYVPVSVDVTIFAKSIDVVASAEKNVRQKLDQFLHPLTGGPAGEGWEFGRDLAASDLYALLEDLDEVDHVGSLRLLFGDTESEERVTVDPDSLLASGTHKVDMSVAVEKR